MQFSDEEFLILGYSGLRNTLAALVRSKTYMILEILAILLYSALIVLYLVFDDDVAQRQVLTLYSLEIALLGIFIADILI